MPEFLRQSDAFAWAMETDPALRSTVVSIFRLDRSPDWDEVVDRFDRIGRSLPVFRKRIVESAPPAPPRWETDPDFDLAFHLRRLKAPAPADFGVVLDIARRAEMDDFDRARPLWEVTLVEGLQGGEAALVCKLHHSLTDGLGGVQIAMILFDLTEEPRDLGDMPAAPVVPGRGGSLTGWRDTATYDGRVLGAAARAALRDVPRALLGGVRRPLHSSKAVAGTAASIYRTVRPINKTGSPLIRERSLVRRLHVHEVPLGALKEAGHAAGGSLNDAFLAGVTGALRLYHEKHGVEVSDLHVTMPISIRGDADEIGGNRITLMRFDLPVGLTHPFDRIQEIHRRAGALRHERSLPYTQLIAGGLNLLPRWYIAQILRHVDFLASDVPGIPVPVFLGGAKVLMQYPFGPTIGSAVNVTLMSYVDTCALGINVDTGAIPDDEVFLECLVAGFDEVLALARFPES